jgi:Tol biopolymer transport system component
MAMTSRSPLPLLCCLIGVLSGPAVGGQQAEPAENGRMRIVFCKTNNPPSHAAVWWIIDPDGTHRETLDPSTIVRSCPPVPRSLGCPLSPVVSDARIDAGSIVLFERTEATRYVSEEKIRRTLAIKETGCSMPALTPQGDKVAFFADGAGGRCLCISDTSEAPEVKVRIPMAGAVELKWSPDGEWITVCGEGSNAARATGLSFIKADGTAHHVIPDLGYRSGLWSPDDQRLAYVTSPPLDLHPSFPVDPIRPNPRKPPPFAAEVFVFRPEGGGKTSIHKGRALPLAWSPDGEWIVCLRSVDHEPPPSTTLTLIKSDGSAERDIAPVGLPGVVTWSPDGSRIAFWMLGMGLEESRVHIVRTDAAGETIPLRSRGTGCDALAWSPDGRFLVTAAGPRIEVDAPPGDKDLFYSRRNLYLIPIDGSEPLQLTSDGTPHSPNVCPFWVVAKK